MFWLTDRKRMRRSIMAILLLCETLLIFLIPLSFVVWMMISKLQAINLDPRNLMDGIEHVAGLIQQKTGYELLSKGNVNTIVSALPRVGQMLMEGITNFAINVLVLLFVLYFMLIGGKKMERCINGILPFNRENKKDVLREFHMGRFLLLCDDYSDYRYGTGLDSFGFVSGSNGTLGKWYRAGCLCACCHWKCG